jgi:4-amino-4-deoxy-L-arabinose transferase-like glycosyltransferase
MPRTAAWAGWTLLLVIAFTAGIRLRLMDLPLERDEGEYAYAGQLMLQGAPPYQLAYNMKLPGTYLAYAAIMAVFGETTASIHLGLTLVNAGTIVLVFVLARKLLDELAGMVAAASYAVMSLSPGVLGTAAHATHFVVLPALGGTLLLLRAFRSNRSKNLFASGLLFGLAFVMKQQGILFGAFGLIYLLWIEWRTKQRNLSAAGRKAAWFVVGLLTPFLLICIWLWLAGVFEAFWFWTFSYAREYATRLSLTEGWREFSGQMVHVLHQSRWLWALAGVGLVLTALGQRLRGRRAFVFGFTLFSFLAVCPGFYFRLHYFILLLPALALLIGLAVSLGGRMLFAWKPSAVLRALPICLFLFAVAFALNRERDFLFAMNAEQACRRLYGSNPFSESIEVARHIQSRSTPDARIAVIGSEPQIYFCARRHSATGYIYTYPLVEPQPFAARMQAEMIHQIESAQPEFLVVVKHPGSWLAPDSAQTPLFLWVADYCNKHYRLDGLVEIFPGEPTRYWWGETAAARTPASQRCLLVFKRKD